MSSTVRDTFDKNSQNLQDQAADVAQAGVRGARQAGERIADKVSDLADSGSSAASDAVGTLRDKGQRAFGQTVDSLRSASRKAGDSVSRTADTIVSYSRENPVQALIVAGVSIALLLSLTRLASRSRRDY